MSAGLRRHAGLPYEICMLCGWLWGHEGAGRIYRCSCPVPQELYCCNSLVVQHLYYRDSMIQQLYCMGSTEHWCTNYSASALGFRALGFRALGFRDQGLDLLVCHPP